MIRSIEGRTSFTDFPPHDPDACTRSKTRGMIAPLLVKDRRATTPGNRPVGTRMIPNVFRTSQRRDTAETRANGGAQGIDNHATQLDASRSDKVIEGQGADR